jgi:flagellar M-ring protein FliF
MVTASPSSNARQLRIVGIVLLVVVALLAAAYYYFLSADYAVLAQGVRPAEAAALVEQLKKEDVPFELRDGGATILVPAGKVDSARLELSSKDIPMKGQVGFELFNQSDMGLTDFAQKVNYQRALQGEIARTIMDMDGIAFARVHIALPERSLFRTTRSEPRAAVTLTPDPGVDIDAARIAGIQRLVAATVPDLALDQVAILNERGQLLTPEFSDVPGAAGSESALEANYRERALRALAQAAPRAHVDIKVTVVARGSSEPADTGPAQPALPRDHDIRVILFERSGLSAGEEEAVRKAVSAELALDPSHGDQISFSPAPQMAGALPAELSSAATPRAAVSASESAQDRFMASLSRAWTIALTLIGVSALAFALISFQRHRRGRRQALIERIREHLLLPDGVADAA